MDMNTMVESYNSTIFYLIAATGAVNAVLGILALTKGKNRLNISFAILSILLAAWNALVILWQGPGGIQYLEKINAVVVAFIPAAGIFLILTFFKITKGPGVSLLKVSLIFSALLSLYSISTFFSPALDSFYNTPPFKVWVLMHIFVFSIAGFMVLLFKYRRVQYKQEKIKIKYVIFAFVVLFTGALFELTGAIGIHRFNHMANIANAIYCLILFGAIFRHRLFDAGVVLKNLIIYSIAAGAATVFYAIAAYFYGKDRFFGVMALFILSFAVFYYARFLHGVIKLFVDSVSGASGTELAARELKKLKVSEINDEEKIKAIIALLSETMEMDVIVYIKEGNYYVPSWSIGPDAGVTVEYSGKLSGITLKYETIAEDGSLKIFGADITAPLIYAGDEEGAITAKKQTADISFMENEISLFADGAAEISACLNSYLLRRTLDAEENMKRIGLMARQMAHEIKNPLTALWGAAQLLDPKNETDAENISIIRDEINRLRGILESWKDFSDNIRVEKFSGDVIALVEDSVKMARLTGKNAEFSFKKTAASLMANFDKDRMKQVVLNILLNAADACEKSRLPLVKVMVIQKEKTFEIKVKDNGTGINPEIMRKLKQPLFTTKAKGTGLGLSISDKIVTAHNGTLIIESDGNTYTEVKIEIPYN
ncbi:MAG: GHKL domain-containing protein [Candidatus Goldbacteria bacterium]|nr:GHKL domain-containing protein [Candidatus Goldiibacteriota bacterium]